MNQLALQFPASKLARRSDPTTSKDAAAASKPFRARHAALILAALNECGAMTAKEIAAHTRIDNVQVSRRGKEMEETGLVTIGPDTRDGCRVWRVKP